MPTIRGNSHEPPKSIDSPRLREDLREAGVLAGDDEVAPQGHVASGTDSDSADLGDRRYRQPVQAEGHVADVAHLGEMMAPGRRPFPRR